MANDKQNHLAKKINNLSVIQGQESLIWKDKKIFQNNAMTLLKWTEMINNCFKSKIFSLPPTKSDKLDQSHQSSWSSQPNQWSQSKYTSDCYGYISSGKSETKTKILTPKKNASKITSSTYTSKSW